MSKKLVGCVQKCHLLVVKTIHNNYTFFPFSKFTFSIATIYCKKSIHELDISKVETISANYRREDICVHVMQFLGIHSSNDIYIYELTHALFINNYIMI